VTDVVTRECPAKANLFLRVLAREDDGYHGIETLFCRLTLSDTLTVTRTPSGITLAVEGGDVGPNAENLAWRAAEAVLAATGNRFGVAMELVKRIPVRAGLGGGSSDAAAALHAVNALANHAVPRVELFNFAHRLGADVPFFLSEAALALAWGHGQRILRLRSLPAMPVLLLIPDVPIPTTEAYGWIDQVRQTAGPRGSIALDLDALSTWSDVARMAGNDFESAIFARYPAVRAGFEALAATHPALCRMSGSGSALFAIYRRESERDDAAMQLGRRHGAVVRTSTAS